MLKLDSKIELNAATISAANLCDKFEKEDLDRLGNYCFDGYDRDERSRDHWLKRNEAGMNLALQVQEAKTFPWANSSNVKFPLITIGAMQFHARAYPALLSGSRLVKFANFDQDPSGELAARQERISAHMSWQRLHQDIAWEDQTDKAIFNVAIVGTNFMKSYRSSKIRGSVSELVMAKDLVLNYWSKCVEDCERKTHIVPLTRNDIHERVLRGIYRDVLSEDWYEGTPPARTLDQQKDNRQGVTVPSPDNTTPFVGLEQHVNLDLDQDGYAEPYIITFEKNTKQVLRIVCNFREQDIERVPLGPYRGNIIRIPAEQYFTQKTFIPSPDGGLYGIGFGIFLGPLNESVNSIINMLIDCGTLQTTGGGFLGRGAKMRGGAKTFGPFEWKTIDATGDDLRKSIFPLPVNAPSDVLFQLLGLLIDYASRVSGTTDITVGENPGQNTPAQTSQTMVEMGQKIYTAIFKRIWRSMKEEYTKLYRLNAVYSAPGEKFVGGATTEDYQLESIGICPVADPNLTSDGQRLQQAMALKTASQTAGGYNKDAVERRFLQAIKVEGIQEVFPGTAGTPPPEDPKVIIKRMEIEGKAALQERTLAAEMQQFIIEAQEERAVNQANILELHAKAAEHAANAENEAAYAQVALIQADISRAESYDAKMQKRIEGLLRLAEMRNQAALDEKKLKLEERKLSNASTD